ncbi:MAG: NAD(P)H-dependent oxidoreductase, partial [Clostridia bacterium]|nr:NAD(P)H-dependent oxidoreductase [Clostridia bacterium]
MKILVFNGSPKGANSVTLQTVRYLAKKFPEHVFEAIHVGQRIKALEKDFTGMAEKIAEADIILFSYPVYTFIAPSQLHRFIELLKEHNISLEGKYVTQITTSKHFYDVTAHKYIEENVYDLKGKFIKGLSADMEDLLGEKGQNEAVSFWKYVMYCVENDFYENIPQPYTPHNNIYKATTYQQNHAKVYDVVIVADFGEEDENLKNMIADFRNIFPYETRVVNIREYPFIGGCLGCFNCASDGKCIYVDGFDSFLREKIQTADSIIYAFNVKDHSMGARF